MKFVLLIVVLVILGYYNYCCVESFYAAGKETKSATTKSATTKSATTSKSEDLSKSAETLIKNHLDNLNSKDDFNDKIKLESLISNIKTNANKILGLNLENSLKDLLN